MVSTSSIPKVIQGNPDSPAGEYGRTAYQNAKTVKDQLSEGKNPLASYQLITTGVRYTPGDTLKNRRLNEDGIKNLVAYADEYIQTHDKNKDGVLTHSDFYEQAEVLYKPNLDQIDYELRHPDLDKETRVHLEAEKQRIFQALDKAAENSVTFHDIPDSNGKLDGQVTRAEAAAYFATQDSLLENIQKNKNSILAEYEQKAPNASALWFQIQAGVVIGLAQVINKVTGHEAAFKTDGHMSGPERLLSTIWARLLPESHKKALIQAYQQYKLEKFKSEK